MGITGLAAFPHRRSVRLLAGAVGLAPLIWVGAISPHLVHHLFEVGDEQACLMLAEADGLPCLISAPPTLLLPRTPQGWLSVHPRFSPSVHLPIAVRPRAPPSMPG
jgi:hypothetical protein